MPTENKPKVSDDEVSKYIQGVLKECVMASPRKTYQTFARKALEDKKALYRELTEAVCALYHIATEIADIDERAEKALARIPSSQAILKREELKR